MNPNIGEEYLFGLHRIVDPLDPMDGGELGVTLCDLFLEWGAEDEEDLAMCACDPCGGACDDFEVRQLLVVVVNISKARDVGEGTAKSLAV